MDNFVPNLLIGLREGLEATLIVSILAAYLVKIDRRDRMAHLSFGVGAAVALSLAFGAALTFTSANLSTKAQEGLGGILSLVAVVLVTWMVFWMRKTARNLSGELRGKMDAALSVGAGAVVFTAFLAVAREGLETALFLWATIDSTNGSTVGPMLGALVGILIAILLGYLLYNRVLTFNLGRFFTWTGGALIVVAAGVAAYGVGDLQEADLLPGHEALAFDLSDHISESSWYGALLKGIFNISPVWSWAQLGVWLGYLVPVMAIYVCYRYLFRSPEPAAAPAPATAAAGAGAGAVPAGPDTTRIDAAPAADAAIPTAEAAIPTQSTDSPSGQHRDIPAPAGNNDTSKPADSGEEAAPKEDEVMGWRRTLTAVPVLSVSVVGLLLAGGAIGFALNGGSDGTAAGTAAGASVVTAGDDTCAYSGPALSAGTHTFKVSNTTGKAIELYFIGANGQAVGEVENVGPGTSRNLTVDLAEGDYTLRCRPTSTTGDGVTSKLTIAAPGASAPGAAYDPRLYEAVGEYRVYVEGQTGQLVTATETFAAAVKSGDVEAAKRLYAPARVFYERIEPVAESFGDLDPAIDAREGDVPDDEWTGFHVIERDLWVNGKTSDPVVADKLLADVKKLQTLVTDVKLTPSQLGNGAAELLNEVATSKVTGEEERYSHTDLIDFAANVEGARAAYEPLLPVLKDTDPELAKTIDARLTDVEKALEPYKSGDGYVDYTSLSDTQVRALSDKVDGLAEPLSKLTGAVAA
ncbi:MULTISPECIES: iron uptake system protein EfeO [unclassified Pseudofrankia]|uniref:iron uptake system protein EfeO n=1 Tax=unclassified Pseudofrankia TaxID=2994372 RepID=UPI000ADF8370|nr:MULTISPECIES: iron uptake system protein EfeO [unclassified Pseudofrankia]MDT3438701.1 FTR1 family protein [Pseudofrankia sp. BMG5.37]